MMTESARRHLAAAFPGAFLLRKRCRCTVHTATPGQGRAPLCWVVPCARCVRFAWVKDPQRAVKTYEAWAAQIRALRASLAERSVA
jgi:hypothetical protein